MKNITFALLIAVCALAAPRAQAPPGSRVTGTITVALDVRETPRKLLHVRETLNVTPGALTLVYPKWLPGEHAPDGPIDDLVGLNFSAAGRSIAWRRDPVDLFAFHVDIPQGVNRLDVSFDFLAAIGQGGFSSASSDTAHLGIYSWNQVLLYPQGARTDDVMFRASIELPAGWKFGTALPVANQNGATIEFQPVSLTTLVDSPVVAGEYLRIVPLDNSSSRPVEAVLVGDTSASIDVPNDLTAKWKRLVQEADAMFGARHYTNYHFLLTLSDRVAHFGLEHQQSNDSRVPENSLTQENSIGVVAHEYVHSWNGKYRRPAGLATPDFQQPMVGDLLWVYEGLTQYLGYVLAERSGIWSESYYKEQLAQIAASLDNEPGRRWRPLADTTTAAQLLYFAPGQWTAYRRSTDFYDEGWLIWLDVDTLIREKSGDRKSLDDFAAAFFGVGGTSYVPMTYTFEDVVRALNAVQPYDWAPFLRARLDSHGPAPLDGVSRGGYKLTYRDTPTDYFRNSELRRRVSDMTFSLGFVVSDDGRLTEVLWDGPAFKNSLVLGTQVISVNGAAYSGDRLREAVRDAQKTGTPIELSVKNGDRYRTVSFNYRDGLRYPRLERDPGKPARLDQILAGK